MNSFAQMMRSTCCAVWFFPSCSSVWPLADSKFTELLNSLKAATSLLGKKKNPEIVRVEEVINQNNWICHYLLIACCSDSRQDSHTFPTSSDRQWKRAAFQCLTDLHIPPCSTSCTGSSGVALKALTDSTVQHHNPAGAKSTQLALPNCTHCPLLL